MPDSGQLGRTGSLRFTFRAFLIAIVIFVGVAPTLDWLEFSGGSENLVVSTILEMRRGGPWLVPQLNGVPRTAKPPLPNWIGAILVPPASVEALSNSPNRDDAYRTLSWQIRWPALAVSCAGLVAGAWLGRILFGEAAGLTTAAIMGSSILFLRFGRSLSTDVYLMLCVTTANAFFALALLDGRRWVGCALGGLALGFALMSKGPVALVQTIVPFATLAIFRWWTVTRRDTHRIGIGPIALAAAMALLIALPWPMAVLMRMSGQLGFWYRQMTQGGDSAAHPDPPTQYLALIPLMLPWIAFFFLGFVLLVRERTERGMLTLAMLVTPILVMCCFREKNERYLLPMLAPAAIVCAVGFLRRGVDIDPTRRIIAWITWAIVGAIAVGLPIAGAFMSRQAGGAWWSAPIAACGAGIGAIVILSAFRSDRDGRRLMLPVTVFVMLAAQAMFMYGYSKSPRGLSDGRPLAEVICKALPADTEVWFFTAPDRFSRIPVDTTIYLNRLAYPARQPTTLPATSHPRAMLVHFRRDQPIPAGLEGWREIGSTPKNEGIWRVFTDAPKP